MDKRLQKAAISMMNMGNKINFKITKDKQDSLIVNYCKKSIMFCLMIKNNKLVKVATLVYSIDKVNHSVFVAQLDVCQDFQFIGIGSNMINCLQNYAKSIGLEKMELVSLSHSLKFYQKLGFEKSTIAEEAVYFCDIML